MVTLLLHPPPGAICVCAGARFPTPLVWLALFSGLWTGRTALSWQGKQGAGACPPHTVLTSTISTHPRHCCSFSLSPRMRHTCSGTDLKPHNPPDQRNPGGYSQPAIQWVKKHMFGVGKPLRFQQKRARTLRTWKGLQPSAWSQFAFKFRVE